MSSLARTVDTFLAYGTDEYWELANALELVENQEPSAMRGNHANLMYVLKNITKRNYNKIEAVEVAKQMLGY